VTTVTPTGTEVYVTNVGSNTVLVIDTSMNTVTKTISGFEFPESLGVFIKP
jgi:YVTN family beta-propeller protein